MHGYYFYPLPDDDPEKHAVVEKVTRIAYMPLILFDVELLGGKGPASYPTHIAPQRLSPSRDGTATNEVARPARNQR